MEVDEQIASRDTRLLIVVIAGKSPQCPSGMPHRLSQSPCTFEPDHSSSSLLILLISSSYDDDYKARSSERKFVQVSQATEKGPTLICGPPTSSFLVCAEMRPIYCH